MLEHNIPQQTIDLVKYCRSNFDSWLTGFESVEASVKDSVSKIRLHPLIPKDVAVYGLVMDPHTGEVELIA